MSIDHPFQNLFESLDSPLGPHSAVVNCNALEDLEASLNTPAGSPGRCILLRAPQAGYGKTHLLLTLAKNLGKDDLFVRLRAADVKQIEAVDLLEDVLTPLLKPLPAGGGLTQLDLISRNLFADALRELLRSGEIACQDRTGVMESLQTRAVETLDFHHPNAATAHWVRDQFYALRERIPQVLANRYDLQLREASLWTDALFRFAVTDPKESQRISDFSGRVSGGAGRNLLGQETVFTFLNLIATQRKVIVVVDELENFASQPDAALRLLSLIGGMRRSVKAVNVILSVNADVWENTFRPQLTGALADRLTEVVIDLEPMNRDQMVALIDARSPGFGETIFRHIKMTDSQMSPRALLREAGSAWRTAKKKQQAASSESSKDPEIVADNPGINETMERAEITNESLVTNGDQSKRSSLEEDISAFRGFSINVESAPESDMYARSGLEDDENVSLEQQMEQASKPSDQENFRAFVDPISAGASTPEQKKDGPAGPVHKKEGFEVVQVKSLLEKFRERYGKEKVEK